MTFHCNALVFVLPSWIKDTIDLNTSSSSSGDNCQFGHPAKATSVGNGIEDGMDGMDGMDGNGPTLNSYLVHRLFNAVEK